MIGWRHLLFGAGKVNLTDDGGAVQVMQLQMSAVEARDGTPMVQHFGLASTPPAGSDAMFAAIGGERGKPFGIGSNHPASRPRGTPAGGVKLYDQGGRFVGLLNDGNIVLTAPGETLEQLINARFVALFNTHTHPRNGAPPAQQATATHLTGATKAGCP